MLSSRPSCVLLDNVHLYQLFSPELIKGHLKFSCSPVCYCWGGGGGGEGGALSTPR